MTVTSVYMHQVQEDLKQHLKDAIISIKDALDKEGVNSLPKSQYTIFWMEPSGPNSSTSREEIIEELSPSLLFLIHENLVSELDSFKALSANLQSFTHKFGGLPPSAMVSEGYMFSSVVLTEYYSRVQSLEFDDAVAGTIIAELVTDVASPTILARSSYLVQSFDAVREFGLSEEVSIRRITKKDIADKSRSAIVSFFTHRSPWINEKDWVVEILHADSRDTFDAVNWHHDEIRAIAATLSLVAEGNASLILLNSTLASPFFGHGVHSGTVPFSTGPSGTMNLDDHAIDDARQLYPRVATVLSGKGGSKLKLPIERMISAGNRKDREDQLVDYVIALERLLASDSPQLEVAFRFRLRGAALLPDRFGTTRERIDLLTQIYTLRSDVVHGNANVGKVTDLVPKAEDALRSILRWFLEHLEDSGDPSDFVRKLDEGLVEGGSQWLDNAHSQN